MDTKTQISADEVMTIIQSDKKFILLDVRTEPEFRRGTIPGSVNLPIENAAQTIESIVADKNAQILLFCLSASRSDIVALQLRKLGYKNAFSMTHGLLEWRNKKYPVTA